MAQELVKFSAHHLLCIQGFQGAGYSDRFVQNMAAIIATLTDDTPIQVVYSNDGICEPCPNRRPSINGELGCVMQSKVSAIDRRALSVLGYKDGEQTTWAEVKSRIARTVRGKDLAFICEGCEWLSMGVCATAIDRLAQGT